MLMLTTDLGVQKTQRMRFQVATIEPSDLLRKFRQRLLQSSQGMEGMFQTQEGAVTQADGSKIDPDDTNWNVVSQVVQKHIRSAPTIGFA
jgi:hypothetical protein